MSARAARVTYDSITYDSITRDSITYDCTAPKLQRNNHSLDLGAFIYQKLSDSIIFTGF